MKKSFLLTLLMAVVGIFTMQATSVMIDVDNAANVTVQTMAGNGQTLDLLDGMNRFDLSESDQPLLIEANPGAEIVSITRNEEETVNPSGDGKYRVGFDGPTMFKIVTSGSGGQTAKNVTIGFNASGEGVSGKPFSVYYEKDSEWVVPESGSMGMLVIPENANVKIVPQAAYEIVSCSVPYFDGAFSGTLNEDGSYVFVNTVPDYYSVKVEMKIKSTAIRFSLTVDYAPNVSCYLENQREGAWELLTVYDNVKTNFVIVNSQNPLEFIAAPGAEILQVLRNGEVMNPTGWGGSNGWVVEVEDGDDFVVSTKGAPTDITIEAPEGNASLESYFFKKADGSEINLSGMTATYTGNLGETIYVSGRPGTNMSYIMNSNGGVTNMLDWLRVVNGSDGSNPAKYQIFGTRNFSGIMISVDNAQRVNILQEGGRGDALSLNDGNNNFQPSEIKNSLAISATEGNQLVYVTVNGNPVAVSPNGYYMVEAKEGDWIEVSSRKNPVDATVSFTFEGEGNVSWLQATSEGIPVELSNPMTVKSYSTLIFSAADGYVLENITCDVTGVEVLHMIESDTYSVTVSSPEVTELELNVTVKEMQPAEGYSIAVPNGDELLVRFWEMTEKDGSMSDTFVKKLENNRVNEVKTGNWIRIYCQDTQSEFVYVKVNGEEVELVRNDEGLARIAWVQVNGRTVIDTKVETPLQAKTNPTYDDNKHIVAGNVYIEIDGEKLTQAIVYSGQTIKLVAEPETGYIFDHFEKFYSLTMAADGIALEGDTYTFTPADAQENFILFKGVFKEDPNARVYALRGSTAWINYDSETESPSAIGNVYFRLADGNLSRETTALEGQTVHLEIGVLNEEDIDKYEVAGFCLMNGFPTAIIPANYVVQASDADAEGTIWISGLVRLKGDAVDEIADESFGYDAATMTVTSEGPVRIYDTNGMLLIEAERGPVSVSHLRKGMYIAVTDAGTIKFVI